VVVKPDFMQIVTSPSVELITQFLQNAGDSLKSFRYFDRRPVQSINNHLVTMLLLNGTLPIGYGHLDVENGNVWLGIAVSGCYRGMGLGSRLMAELIDFADASGIEKINLSVDKDNKSAISLYQKFDFSFVRELNARSALMVRHSNKIMDVYISTLAFSGLSPEEMIQVATHNEFALEFSSGLPYSPDMEKLYINTKVKRVPHNYFPAPPIPFVLNLASANKEIRLASVAHCKKGLFLSELSQSPFFSAHAGFCIDPSPRELGNKIKVSHEYTRELNMSFFIESLTEILEFQNNKRQKFLIENNVIARFNMTPFGNPLLCCESKEIIDVLEKLNNKNIGLLLDTAHLRVSCETLGLDIHDEIFALKPYIKCIHHSDNNGIADTNDRLKSDYWFLKYIKDFKNIPHVLEVKNINPSEIKEQISLIQEYGSK